MGRRVRKRCGEADQEAVLATFGGECCAARQMYRNGRRRQVAAFDQDLGALRHVQEMGVDRAHLLGEADAAVVRFETASVRNSTVGESDRRLRAILIDTAAEGQVFGVAVTRGKRLGLSVEEVALATKALRASQLLAFDDPLTEASNLRLVG